MGHIEEQIFQQYNGKSPDLYKRYIDDIVGAASCNKQDQEDFASFVNNFHPSLKFTWAISDDKLPFLDPYLKPSSNRLITTIHYKETDSHSYLKYSSSHPVRCKNSIPYSQLLLLRRICSEERDFEAKSKEMAGFLLRRDYPPAVVDQALRRVKSTSCDTAMLKSSASNSRQQSIPLVLTFHPINAQIKNIMTRNFDLLKSDSDAKEVFQSVRILRAYRRDTNLRDALVRSCLSTPTLAERDPGTFPCGRPRCVTCAHTNPSQTVETPGSQVRVHKRFTFTSTDLVYTVSCRVCHMCYIGERGRRLGDRFREHRRSVRGNMDLPVAKHFSSAGHDTADMLVSVICAGFAGNTLQRHRAEARLIFRHETMHPKGMNVDFAFV